MRLIFGLQVFGELGAHGCCVTMCHCVSWSYFSVSIGNIFVVWCYQNKLLLISSSSFLSLGSWCRLRVKWIDFQWKRRATRIASVYQMVHLQRFQERSHQMKKRFGSSLNFVFIMKRQWVVIDRRPPPIPMISSGLISSSTPSRPSSSRISLSNFVSLFCFGDFCLVDIVVCVSICFPIVNTIFPSFFWRIVDLWHDSLFAFCLGVRPCIFEIIGIGGGLRLSKRKKKRTIYEWWRVVTSAVEEEEEDEDEEDSVCGGGRTGRGRRRGQGMARSGEYWGGMVRNGVNMVRVDREKERRGKGKTRWKRKRRREKSSVCRFVRGHGVYKKKDI